ncbi:MAG: hypothetical protein AAF170_12475 [Bacteroidota bacterium]
MQATDRSGRTTYIRLAEALEKAGFARSSHDLRAVLNGEKRSRPVLREISATIDAIRQLEEQHLPDGL